MKPKVGEKRPARDIDARLLWTKRDDVQWATDPSVFEVSIGPQGLRRSKLAGVIFVGGHHENDPREIWATELRPANHLDTEYTCVFVEEDPKPLLEEA